MIKFNINIKKNVPIVKLIKYRSINKINIKDFIDNILSSLEGNILSSLLLNDCLIYFRQIYSYKKIKCNIPCSFSMV